MPWRPAYRFLGFLENASTLCAFVSFVPFVSCNLMALYGDLTSACTQVALHITHARARTQSKHTHLRARFVFVYAQGLRARVHTAGEYTRLHINSQTAAAPLKSACVCVCVQMGASFMIHIKFSCRTLLAGWHVVQRGSVRFGREERRAGRWSRKGRAE